MDYLFILSRVLFGGYFLMSGINHFGKHQAMTQYATFKGVPSPRLAVLGSGFLIVVGGLGILLGAYIQWAVLALVLFLIPVSFKMHAFWSIDDQNMKMTEMVNFKKNMALLGASLAYLFIPTPWFWSLW